MEVQGTFHQWDAQCHQAWPDAERGFRAGLGLKKKE